MASEFSLVIPNMEQLIIALQAGAENTHDILQQAVEKTVAVLASHTTRGVVPWRTGNLVQTFQAEISDLMAIWKPTASYAPYVEFGTAPHEIVPIFKQALFWPNAGHPVMKVQHPGTRPQPYMEAIIEASQTEVTALFNQALQIIIQDASEF